MPANTNPEVDLFLQQGCMRCKFGGTPRCKVHDWQEELKALRELMLRSGLVEELKWSMPCYTTNGKNIAMVSAFRDFACLSFFKGALLADPEKILEKQGENSQSARILKFTDTLRIKELEFTILAYIREAIELESAGAKVDFKKGAESIPQELADQFAEQPELEKAFRALTPGRQRGYIIYFSQPKSAESRLKRIDKHAGDILAGKGLHDDYGKQK